MKLTKEHQKKIKEIYKEFSVWQKTDEYLKWENVIKIRIDKYNKLLAKECIKNITKEAINGLIIDLWASLVWTNKDYLIERIWKNIDLSEFQNQLYNLIYGTKGLQDRYDNFTVKGLGISSATEIMILADCSAYPLLNNRAQKGLLGLGFGDILPFLSTTSPVQGKHYVQFKEAMDLLAKELKNLGYEFCGYFGPDILLHYITTEYIVLESTPPESVKKGQKETGDFDHDEAIDSVLELGAGLGFEVSSEHTVASGARIDAIWKIKIANLGTISYVFEVHRRGSRDSAILNLQKAQQDSSVQKLVIVTTDEEIQKFKKEIETLPESFRNSVSYLNILDLNKSINLITELKNKLEDLNLLR
jgi:hypothetical protein